ncbi:LuxR C-terminal-related transcriptional regulator [Solirubrobacter taibaiensis]|nr:LuxR C-terminal-related transcriptional regulator [Solirubrobacter taibaiensis]
MIGREAQLQALRSALEDAAAGHPSVWLVAGEAGIGKTRLVAEVEAAAACTVLRGESVELGGEELPLGPVVAALRGHGGLPAAEGPGALYELVLEQLGRLGEDAPVLLVLEDIHWADRATLALLAFLARNLRAERIVVAATYRTDDELRPDLRRLARELARRRGVTRIALEPLTRDEVQALVETLAGTAVPARVAADLHARAGGNPLFVEELFAARTATLAEAVAARVERLDGAMLATVAAAGGRASFELLERLSVGVDALRAALDAGVLIRDRDGGVAFRHGLLGEIVYERLLPAERAALHRRIAGELEDAAERAHHCERAGLRDEALAASLQAGAEASAVFAYDAALLHYERALRLGERSAALLAASAQAARFAGQPERAVALCREAIAGTADDVDRARLYERLGEFHFWDDEAALECYDRGLALLPDDPGLLAARGHALMGLRRWAESRACCEAGLEVGAAPRITLGVVLAHLGEAEAGEAHLRRALELAAGGEETARAYLHLGELLRVRGEYAGALAVMDEGEREAARVGLMGSFGQFMYVNGADDRLRLGRWDEAADRLARAARMELSRTAAALRRATAGQLHALRGDVAAARAELDAAGDDALPSEFLAPLAAARATLALAERRPEAARLHLTGALGLVQDPLYTPPLYSLALRAEADAAVPGAVDGLLVALDQLLVGGGGPPPPGARAHRALAAAEHSRALGASSRALWDAAVAAFDALGEPYPAAYARLRLAEAVLLAGEDRTAATAALRLAHERAVALGARPLADDALALARRARLDLAGAAAPACADSSGLTAREIEVVQLLADALTNREIAERLFITEKTVSAHLAHIFSKLDVHSRLAAATRADRLGLLERSSARGGVPPQG